LSWFCSRSSSSTRWMRANVSCTCQVIIQHNQPINQSINQNEKSFELTTETRYGGTVTNVKRKSSRRWQQLQQNYESQSMCGHANVTAAKNCKYQCLEKVTYPFPSVSFPLEVGPLNPPRGSGERWVSSPSQN